MTTSERTYDLNNLVEEIDRLANEEYRTRLECAAIIEHPVGTFTLVDYARGHIYTTGATFAHCADWRAAELSLMTMSPEDYEDEDYDEESALALRDAEGYGPVASEDRLTCAYCGDVSEPIWYRGERLSDATVAFMLCNPCGIADKAKAEEQAALRARRVASDMASESVTLVGAECRNCGVDFFVRSDSSRELCWRCRAEDTRRRLHGF